MGLNEQKAAAYVGAIATVWNATTGPATPQLLYRAAPAASNTALTLPAGCDGKWLDLYSSDLAFQYAFSTSGTAATLVLNQTAAIGTGNVAAGPTLPAGQIHSRLIPKGATHISLISSGTTGFWELVLSEAPAL